MHKPIGDIIWLQLNEDYRIWVPFIRVKGNPVKDRNCPATVIDIIGFFVCTSLEPLEGSGKAEEPVVSQETCLNPVHGITFEGEVCEQNGSTHPFWHPYRFSLLEIKLFCKSCGGGL